MNTRIAFALIALTFSLSACGAPDEYAEDAIEADAQAVNSRGGRFETFAGRDGRFYFHLLAGNGQKVLQSQGYATAQAANDGIDSVRANGVYADPYQILQTKNGQWYFNLFGGNWQIIATSEVYVSRANADRAVAAIISLLKNAVESPAPTSGALFQIFRGLDGKYYFHLRAGNGEIVLQSQGYTTRSSAVAGSLSVSANGTDARRYQVKDAANGQAYFVVTAKNGQVIGLSETYASTYDAQRAVSAVVTLIQGGRIGSPQ